MFSSLLSNYNLFFFYLLHALFFEKKYVIFIMVNLFILSLLYFGTAPMLCFKASAVLSIFSGLLHNRRFKSLNILRISTILVGFIIITIQEIDSTFIYKAMNSIMLPEKALFTSEILVLSSVMMISSCGIIYLFTKSSPLFKIITFITPMYISLFIIKDMSSLASFMHFKHIMFLIGAMYLVFFSNNLKVITSQIIIFFYYIQILFIPLPVQELQKTTLQLWLNIVTLILVFQAIYIPNASTKYSIQDIKKYIRNSKNLIIFLFIFVFNCLFNFLILLKQNVYCCVFFIIILSYLFGKIYYFYKKNKYFIDVNTKIRTFKKVIYMCFLVFSTLFLIKTSNICSFFKEISFIQLNITFLIKCFFVIACVLFAFFFTKYFHPCLNIKIYSSIFSKISNIINTIYLINKTVIIEFIKSFNIKTISSMSMNITEKISDILYGNYIYFYILMLFEILILLVIECIVL